MNYLELNAIKVEQPLCDFYITSIKAIYLRELCFSEQLQYLDESGRLQGSQRKIDVKRLKDIGKYIDSVEMSFPNSIILAVNYSEQGELIDNENLRWDIKNIEENLYKIFVPTKTKLAVIIDGQHRLKGFDDDYITKMERLNVDIPCSLFFDLPNSYQAFLFATINGNQKKVDKSLALEQFGFNVEDEPPISWTPEKLAVYFTRKLNFTKSPISGHIKIAPKISADAVSKIIKTRKDWTVSTATIVEGILGLITSNPKRDRVEMAQESIFGKRSRSMVQDLKDKSPLRSYYLDKKDELIYQIVFNYLDAVRETVWEEFESESYIFKTVGIQALFDLLRAILNKNIVSEKEKFKGYLKNAKKYNFSNKLFQASGIGRKDIKNVLLLSSGLIKENDLNEKDIQKIRTFLN